MMLLFIIFCFLIFEINRLYLVMDLYSNRLQNSFVLCYFFFLLDFNVICNLLLIRNGNMYVCEKDVMDDQGK